MKSRLSAIPLSLQWVLLIVIVLGLIAIPGAFLVHFAVHAWVALVKIGLYHYILAALVGILIGRLLTWRPLKKHGLAQQKIIDLLDTNTPGGLADVRNALAGAIAGAATSDASKDDDDVDADDNTPPKTHHIPHPPITVRGK